MVLQAAGARLRPERRYSPGGILAIMVVGIVLAEVVAMIVIYFIRDRSYFYQVFLDATVMTVIILPLLYFLSFKPLLLHIQQQAQSESILQSRLHLIEYANTHTLEELLQFAVDEIEILTGSGPSRAAMLEADEQQLRFQVWSSNNKQKWIRPEPEGEPDGQVQIGWWEEAVRYRQPVTRNYTAEGPGRRGNSAELAPVRRQLSIPILRDNRVLAVFSFVRTARDFTENDIKLTATLADFAWDIIEHKQAENALHESEEKFRTFADWTYDWENWLDPLGRIVYTSPSCERITGYTPDEFIANPELLIELVHPDDRAYYTGHHRIVHEASAGPITIEYRIVSRDGSEHWLEHICRPLSGPDGRYLGRRISNRDITQRKQDERVISEQNQKETALTQRIQTIRTEIARDLHDTLGQNISFLRMNLEHLVETENSLLSGKQGAIQKMAHVADESYELIRAMLVILQTGDSADLQSLFTRYGEQVAGRSSFEIDFTSRGSPVQLSPHQIRQLFYIFREALSNIEKYADAGRVVGVFQWDAPGLTFKLTDDGRGFDLNGLEAAGHYGLRFMRERAELLRGSFSVHTALHQGTEITVIVPYENPHFIQES